MKKVLIAFILFVTLIGVVVIMFKLGERPPSLSKNLSEPEATPQVKGVSKVSIGSEEYSFAYIKAEVTSKIKLLPNFSKQETSQEIIDKGMCKYLVNAGFYSEKYKPIGLFISQREVLSAKQVNATFNGFFLVSEGEIPHILRDVGEEEYRIGLQSGPILILESTSQKLNLINEEQEKDRRIVTAINEKGEIYFIVIFKEDSVFSGPTLASLPEVLIEIQNSLGEKFVSALNLDGGAASSFWGEEFTLKELSPIGSYFCIN